MALPYAVAACLVPVLSYMQPRLCSRHLFLPYVVPTFTILCLAAGAAQTLISWRPGVRLIVGAVFAVAIQGVLVVPCVSELDWQWMSHLFVLTLYMTALASFALVANAVWLLQSGPFRALRTLAAVGFAMTGMSLVSAVVKQYLTMIGAVPSDPFVALAEARMPVSLMIGVGTAAFGTGAAHVQRLRRVRHRALA